MKTVCYVVGELFAAMICYQPLCVCGQSMHLEFADNCVTGVWGVGAKGTSGRWKGESCTLFPAFGQHGVTGMHQDECLLGSITPCLVQMMLTNLLIVVEMLSHGCRQ